MKTQMELARRKFYSDFTGVMIFGVRMGILGPSFVPLDEKTRSFLNEFPLFVSDILETAGTRQDSTVNWHKVVFLKITGIDDSSVEVVLVEQE